MCIKVWLLDRMKEETSTKLDNMKDTTQQIVHHA